jgi:hypothetical protein
VNSAQPLPVKTMSDAHALGSENITQMEFQGAMKKLSPYVLGEVRKRNTAVMGGQLLHGTLQPGKRIVKVKRRSQCTTAATEPSVSEVPKTSEPKQNNDTAK